MSIGLSKRQQEVLDVIVNAFEQEGIVPSYREIGRRLGIRSTNGVSDHVGALIRKGYLEKVGGHGAARAIRLTPKARTVLDDARTQSVPLVGRIAAGAPILAQEEVAQTFHMDRSMLPSGAQVFALEVEGDSMIGDGIHDGDMVFVQKRGDARDGDIVAALFEGEATVKRIFREPEGIRLQPSNPRLKDIWVPPDTTEFEVMGHVVAVYRQL